MFVECGVIARLNDLNAMQFYIRWILARAKRDLFLSSNKQKHHANLTTHSSSFEKLLGTQKFSMLNPKRSLTQKEKVS